MDIDLNIRFLDDLAGLGVTIPAATATARDTYEAALVAANRQPSDDLRRALDAGEITPENVAERVFQAAADLTAQQSAHALVNSLRTGLNKAMNQGMRDEAERIHHELAAVFAPAAAAIGKAAQHFGPGTTAEEVIGLKPEAIKLWNQADAHSQTLETVSRAYRSLLSEVTRQLPDEIATLFLAGHPDLDQAAELYRQPNRWLALAHAGFELRLNTPEQATEVAEQWAQSKARIAAAEREAQLQAHREQHMPVGLR